MNKYERNGIKSPSKIQDWKTFKSNNTIIALNVLFEKEMKICSAQFSKYNSTREKQVILLIYWHYLAVKKLSTLLNRIILNYDGNFYCLNCLHCFRTEKKLKSHEKVCKSKDFGKL